MASAAEVEISRPATTFAAEQPPSPPQFRIDQGRVAASQLGWLRSTPANATIDEIRQRLQDDGYVWVKSVLPREDVLGMREHFFSQFAGRGLLKPGTAAVDGIYNAADDVSLHWGVGDGNPQGDEELRRLTNVHTTAQYLQFVNHSALRKTVHDITGWDKSCCIARYCGTASPAARPRAYTTTSSSCAGAARSS
ncbi:hypothetical protein PV05_08128 [Exophiala xenobiotica]|uniref:Uncharacterized protein n=1 Tax=Exophiala xenobiotica TaxID=348802 RepID=A0A0D2BJA1_9EURO|nr:uncharacterized protein PV05_08128 [Exophiala xenobiotica]KIW52496.1 hypothetical protein PV05_08128 [Exophiala xenobiotica]MBV36557.1 hypothetical protein [Rickettsiales bacterium]